MNMPSRQSRRKSPPQKTGFALNPVAAGCTLALVLSANVMAQQAPQVVEVTGIRRGIENAINVKKNADSIVEAVSAEDIGKLPDISVAESLSRLPGVTVQRSAVSGRAQGVSVRGMSPDFNGGLLNGREMASTGSSRGVEFDQYPSELLSTLIVHKTPDASLLGQGLSSTINQLTVRPLDFGKRTVAVGYRAEHNAAADSGPGFGTGSGNRVSVSYIDQFADRTVGLALGFTRSDNQGGGRPKVGWGGSVDYNVVKNEFGGWDGSNCGTGGADCRKAPAGIQFDTETVNSKRDGAMAVLQFKPNKNFETTLDYFHSKGDFSVKKRGLEGPVGALSTGSNDSGGALLPGYTVSNGVITAGTLSNFRGVIRAHNEDYTDTLDALGLNAKLKLQGGWALNGDLSSSKVKKDAVRLETTSGIPGNVNNPADTISWTGFNGNNTDVTKFTTGLNYTDPNIIKLTNVQGWGGTAGQDGYYANPVTKDSIESLRFSAKKDLNMGLLTDVDFGVNLADRTKTRKTAEGALLVPGSVVTANRAFANVPNPGTGFAGTSGVPILTWEPSGSVGSVYNLRAWTDADILAKSWGVEEKATTFFVRSDLDGKLFGMDVRGNVGVQVIRTSQTSSGNNIDRTTCNGDTHSCSVKPFELGTSYNDVLPSLNLATQLGNERVLRLGLGRQMMRPSMEDLKATIDVSVNTSQGRLEGSSGNPYLKPFRADAIDLSFEQYFGTKGYVSGALFYKKLNTYILRTSQVVDVTPYLPVGTTLPVGVSNLGLLSSPRNGSGGNISGFELAVNIPFNLLTPALNGFGVMASFSNTDSSVKMPTSGFSTADIGGANIPLPGLSKQVTNLRLYYENHGFQVAAAARKRSKFVGSIVDYQDNNQLVWYKPETIIDLQASYEIQSGMFKGLSFLAQANNVTNTEQVRYNEVSGDVKESKKFGAQYLFGANYKF